MPTVRSSGREDFGEGGPNIMYETEPSVVLSFSANLLAEKSVGCRPFDLPGGKILEKVSSTFYVRNRARCVQ